MEKYLSMGLEIKKFTAKKSGLVYYVAFDAYDRPAKIVRIVSNKTGQHFIIDETEERKLLHKFNKISKQYLSLEDTALNFIDAALIKHPVITNTIASSVAIVSMVVIGMFD